MFPEQVADYIQRKQLFAPDDRLLLAVSGGMDSMVLWDVLVKLGYSVAVAHCNYQLREEESDEDEAFVRSQAAKAEVPFYSKRFATVEIARRSSQSIQEAARTLRYGFFSELRTAHQFDYVLTAHHLDDRIETFWINFVRGAGVKGLTSLRAKREFIRRPLLGVNRAAIQAYQELHKVPFRKDGSNDTVKYQRNAFRQNILPGLYEWAPHLGQSAERNFNLLEQQAFLLEEQIARYRDQLLKRRADGSWVFLSSHLNDHPAALALTVTVLSDFGFDKEQARQVLDAAPGSRLTSATHELLIQFEEAIIRFKAALPSQATSTIWPLNENIVRFGEHQLRCEQKDLPASFSNELDEAWVAAEALQWPLQLRFWQAGDSFCPLGMKGKKQKLQDFFVNNKINQFQREQVPILLNGDGQIIWIVGHRLDDRFKLLPTTQRAFRFQAEPTN